MLNFCEASRFVGWTPLTDTTDKETNERIYLDTQGMRLYTESQKKSAIVFLNNSVKGWPILIIFWQTTS